MTDDGTCHICRRVPARECDHAATTSCVDCGETSRAHRRRRDAETAHDRWVVLTLADAAVCGLLIYMAGTLGWHIVAGHWHVLNAALVIALAWAAHALWPRPHSGGRR